MVPAERRLLRIPSRTLDSRARRVGREVSRCPPEHVAEIVGALDREGAMMAGLRQVMAMTVRNCSLATATVIFGWASFRTSRHSAIYQAALYQAGRLGANGAPGAAAMLCPFR